MWYEFLSFLSTLAKQVQHEYQIFSNRELSRSFDEHISSTCSMKADLAAYSADNIWTIIGAAFRYPFNALMRDFSQASGRMRLRTVRSGERLCASSSPVSLTTIDVGSMGVVLVRAGMGRGRRMHHPMVMRSDHAASSQGATKASPTHTRPS
jgi:hypothetical protein